MARVTVSRAIPASQHDVWGVLSDVPNAQRWNRSWKNIELAGTQTHGVGLRFRTHTENGDTFEFEICDWSAPDRIAFCPVRDPLETLYSITLDSHVFELHPGANENETIVDLSANATASGLRGLIVGMFFWRGHQREGLNAALESIASVFENPTPVPEQDSGLPALDE